MQELRFDGRRVAATGGGASYLDRHVAQLPAHHPLRRFVAAMCLFSLTVEDGTASGPYENARAEQFARAMLISDDELLRRWEQPDERLEVRFGVPAGQVAERRRELLQDG